MQLWQKRIIRLWLVILLPAGLFLAYQAFASHQTSVEMQKLGNEWYEESFLPNDSLEKVRGINYEEEAKECFRLHDKYERQRNIWVIIAGIFLLFPAITWTLAKIYRFVMYGQEEVNKSFNKRLIYAICFALIVFAIVALYPLVLKKKEVAPVPANIKDNDKKIFKEYSSQLDKDSKIYDEMLEREKTPTQ